MMKAQHLAGLERTISWLQVACSTTVPQHLRCNKDLKMFFFPKIFFKDAQMQKKLAVNFLKGEKFCFNFPDVSDRNLQIKKISPSPFEVIIHSSQIKVKLHYVLLYLS